MVDPERPRSSLVLTPTARLARAVQRALATQRETAGESAWRAPDILSAGAWLQRLRTDALVSGAIDTVPVSGAQARALWQQAIDTDIFIGEPRVADLAQRAWRTVHEYRLQHPGQWPTLLMSEDARRFRGWAARFEALCRERGVIDEWAFAARLPDLIAERRIEHPGRVELAGFELPPTPLFEAILDALEAAGTDVDRPDEAPTELSAGATDLAAFAEPDDELRAAAAWARGRLEADPAQSVAVVVPDLGERLEAVERIFRQVFDPPGFALAARGDEPWHVSLGRPLADWPLAAEALLILGLDPARLPQSRATRLLRSPWLADWDDEFRARAEAVRLLMDQAPFEITAAEWARDARATDAHRLAVRIEHWRALRREHGHAAWPSEWARRFQLELSELGFGNGRSLDSREFQVLKRWHDLLDEFGSLDVVAAAPMRRSDAVSALAERAGATTFRERDPGCPIEILGVEEALGARFDAAWITTLDADTWPKPARRDPLIPGPVQTDVPVATGDGCAVRARAELAGLLRIADTLRGSFSTGSDEQPREPTPLLPGLELHGPDPASSPAPVELEIVEGDVSAAECAGQGVRGGTGVLRDQSMCPFRAFGAHRLAAHQPTPPRPGLDAAARGSLIHRALEAFWDGLDGHAALVAMAPDECESRIEDAARRAIDEHTRRYLLRLGAGSRALERRCTVRALGRWLALERERGAFRVVDRERRVEMRFGALELTGKIDRIDETPAGSVLIDYKTGRAGKNAWRPEARIADPQLPAYALALDPPPAAIAFARLTTDDVRFDGLAETDVGIPDVVELASAGRAWKAFDDWQNLLALWRGHLETLAGAFVAGRAEVDPRDAQACRYCDLHALCRIAERQPVEVRLEDAR